MAAITNQHSPFSQKIKINAHQTILKILEEDNVQ
jgi:hypothetical protein